MPGEVALAVVDTLILHQYPFYSIHELDLQP